MSPGTSLLELKNVAKKYNAPDGTESISVLKDINLTVTSGDSLAVTGPSGSGKSTLLNIMGTLDRPSSGQVLFAGQDLVQLGEKQLAALRNQQIGFIFQLHHLLPQLTVLENVLIPTLVSSENNGKDAEARARQLLQRVGLAQRLSHRPGQLSGGERQRVAVVRALINSPKLLLADEPTGSLDQAASKNLGRLLVELNQEEQVALIVVTHSLEFARQMHKVYGLRDGILELN